MLQVVVSNNIRIRGPSTPLRAAITRVLTLDNPEYVARKKKRRPTWGIDKVIRLYVSEAGDIITPRGFLGELKSILKTQGLCPDKVITYQRTERPPVEFGWNPDVQPWPYQVPAIKAAVASESGGVLVSPAGSGKTTIGMAVISEKRQPTLWLTHTQDLLYQSRDAAAALLPYVGEIGILGDGKVAWGNGKLFIATVQTLGENPQLVEAIKPLIGAVVIDEAHHFPAAAFVEVAGKFAVPYMLGLTATPERKDQLDAYMLRGIGPELYRVDRGTLYESGHLIKPAVEFVYTDFVYEQASDRNEIDSVDAGGEDLDYVDLTKRLIADEARARLIAEKILDKAPGNYQIVITESVRYCYQLRDMVEKIAAERRYGGLPRMAVVHGPINRYKWIAAGNQKKAAYLVETGQAMEYRSRGRGYEIKVENYTDEEYDAWQLSKGRRKEIIAAAKDRQIDILFATQLAREGLDMPHLTVGHMAMPKRGDARDAKNGAAVEQEIGRIMRRDPNNPGKKATWYDYVDYNVGVYRDQYYSRRKVYERLGLKLPKKPKTKTDDLDAFLGSMAW